MSRSLGRKSMWKGKSSRAYTEEGKGAKMFADGLPCPRASAWGKQHAQERGWKRAWMAAQKGK